MQQTSTKEKGFGIQLLAITTNDDHQQFQTLSIPSIVQNLQSPDELTRGLTYINVLLRDGENVPKMSQICDQLINANAIPPLLALLHHSESRIINMAIVALSGIIENGAVEEHTKLFTAKDADALLHIHSTIPVSIQHNTNSGDGFNAQKSGGGGMVTGDSLVNNEPLQHLLLIAQALKSLPFESNIRLKIVDIGDGDGSLQGDQQEQKKLQQPLSTTATSSSSSTSPPPKSAISEARHLAAQQRKAKLAAKKAESQQGQEKPK